MIELSLRCEKIEHVRWQETLYVYRTSYVHSLTDDDHPKDRLEVALPEPLELGKTYTVTINPEPVQP